MASPRRASRRLVGVQSNSAPVRIFDQVGANTFLLMRWRYMRNPHARVPNMVEARRAWSRRAFSIRHSFNDWPIPVRAEPQFALEALLHLNEKGSGAGD